MDSFLQDILELTHSETYGPILAGLLAYEDGVVAKGAWHMDGTIDGLPWGWEWYEVNVAPGYLTRLAHIGVVSIVMKSNKHTTYRLTDPEAVRRALRDEIAQRSAPEEPEAQALPEDLFSPIIGYDDVKDLFRAALQADKPVHVLLEGPPASAKTLFLMEIGRLQRAVVALGGSSSKAGLTDLLLTYRPRYLLVDEIETIDNARDYAALLHLMENQEVIETKFRRHARTPLVTWVFAAGNDVSKLPPALLSRFGGPKGVIRFREYTSAEFLDVAAAVLAMREDVPADFARKVATATIDLGSKDVRLAVRLARMAQDETTLARVAETMRRRR